MPGIGVEIVNEAKTIIANVEGDIIAVGEAAWTQTRAELSILAADVLHVIKLDIQALVKNLEDGRTVEEIETELLNLWAGNRTEIINALSSGDLQVLITMAKTALAAL